MTATSANLAKLEKLADLVLQQQLTGLAEITRREEALEKRVAELDAALADVLQSAKRLQEANACPAGRVVHWQKWRHEMRRRLNMELAGIKAEKQAAMASARSAFGRRQALNALAQKAAER